MLLYTVHSVSWLSARKIIIFTTFVCKFWLFNCLTNYYSIYLSVHSNKNAYRSKCFKSHLVGFISSLQNYQVVQFCNFFVWYWPFFTIILLRLDQNYNLVVFHWGWGLRAVHTSSFRDCAQSRYWMLSTFWSNSIISVKRGYLA